MPAICFFGTNRLATIFNNLRACRNRSRSKDTITMYFRISNDVPRLFSCCHDFESIGSGAFHTKTMLCFWKFSCTDLVCIPLDSLTHDALQICKTFYKFRHALTT